MTEEFNYVSSVVPVVKKDGGIVADVSVEEENREVSDTSDNTLDEKKINTFLDCITDKKDGNYENLRQLGTVLKKTVPNFSGELSEREKEIIEVGVEALNKWFEGRVSKGLEIDSPDAEKRLMIGTYLSNQLARIKSDANDELGDLNRKKMEDLVEETVDYSKSFLDEGRLRSEIQALKIKIDQRLGRVVDLEKKFGLIESGAESILEEARGRLEKAIKEESKTSTEVATVLELFERVSPNKKVIMAMLSKNLDFGSAWEIESENDESLKSVFEEALSGSKEFDRDSRDSVLRVSRIDFSDLSTKYRAIEGISKVAELRALRQRGQEESVHLNRRLNVLLYSLENRQSIIDNIRQSSENTLDMIKGNKAGDFYFLKNLLIAQEIARREIDEEKERVVDFRFGSAKFERDEKKRGSSVFYFESGVKFNINRKQMPVMRMMAEMILQKKSERKV